MRCACLGEVILTTFRVLLECILTLGDSNCAECSFSKVCLPLCQFHCVYYMYVVWSYLVCILHAKYGSHCARTGPRLCCVNHELIPLRVCVCANVCVCACMCLCVYQAYSPLGGGSLIDDPDCTRIGKPYNKSSAQVALRWIVQRGAVFTTEASSLEHFQQDLDIFDFELSAADMDVLNKKF